MHFLFFLLSDAAITSVDALFAVNRAAGTGAKGHSMQLYASPPSDAILRIGFWYDDITISDDS
jgi:hypothetical protein